MKTKTSEARNGNLSSLQLKTFEKFRRRLKKKVPDYAITWVRPYNRNIIEVGFEPQKKMTYRKTLQAVKTAIETEDETGVVIILS